MLIVYFQCQYDRKKLCSLGRFLLLVCNPHPSPRAHRSFVKTVHPEGDDEEQLAVREVPTIL